MDNDLHTNIEPSNTPAAVASVAAIEINETRRAEIEKMAACGLTVQQIAAALELSIEQKAAFALEASLPSSKLAQIIENGRAIGIASPQFALHKAAGQGNIEAVRELERFKANNYYVELLNNMDDDEFSL